MPAKSVAQQRLMLAAAHTRGGFGGVPEKVGKEFIGKDGKAASIAAGVIHIAPDGQILLLRRSATETNYANYWSLPGGKADGKETAEEAADREAKEEIGSIPEGDLEVIDVKLTPNGMVFYTFAKSVKEAFAPTLNDEHSGYVWTVPELAPEPMHPSVKAIVAGIVAGADAREAHDALAMDKISVRDYDDNGHLHVASVVISKANISPYRGQEIPGWQSLGLDPDRIYQLYRDPVELARAAHSFDGQPLLFRHKATRAADHQADLVIGAVMNPVWEEPYLKAELVIWPAHAIEAVEEGRQRELSCGYAYTPVMEAGSIHGQPYDGRMTAIAGNHVAIVEAGRIGPEAVIGDSMENLNMAKGIVLSRKGAALLGGVAMYLRPKMAADAKLAPSDLAPITIALDGVTAKNFGEKRAAIADAVRKFPARKLATDAKFDDLDAALIALDAAEPEEKEEEPKREPKGDKRAKDSRKGIDALPEAVREHMEKKMSASDYKAACDAMEDFEAEDEGESEEEKAKREKKEGEDKKARDAEIEAAKKDGEKAMDAAIKSAISGERERQKALREAYTFVRPWVGDLNVACDSAEQVHETALKMRGVKTDGIHASAFKAILEMQPKPGARAQSSSIALDAAGASTFATMFPDAMNVRIGQ